MASRSINLISKKKQTNKQIARAAHFFLTGKKEIAREAGLLSFFAVVLHNYNAVL